MFFSLLTYSSSPTIVYILENNNSHSSFLNEAHFTFCSALSLSLLLVSLSWHRRGWHHAIGNTPHPRHDVFIWADKIRTFTFSVCDALPPQRAEGCRWFMGQGWAVKALRGGVPALTIWPLTEPWLSRDNHRAPRRFYRTIDGRILLSVLKGFNGFYIWCFMVRDCVEGVVLMPSRYLYSLFAVCLSS